MLGLEEQEEVAVLVALGVLVGLVGLVVQVAWMTDTGSCHRRNRSKQLALDCPDRAVRAWGYSRDHGCTLRMHLLDQLGAPRPQLE